MSGNTDMLRKEMPHAAKTVYGGIAMRHDVVFTELTEF